MPNSLEKAQSWIDLLRQQALPNHDVLIQQLNIGHVTDLCECGCNGFGFFVPDTPSLTPLQVGSGLFCEVAFESDCTEEIDMLLLTDARGFFSGVDVTYGMANIDPMPESIRATKSIGIWPAKK